MMWNGGRVLGLVVARAAAHDHVHHHDGPDDGPRPRHRQGSHETHGGRTAGDGSGAERILAERLARGEIDIAEYERRLAVLQPTKEMDRTHGGVRHVG
jgi:hypothetical protein